MRLVNVSHKRDPGDPGVTLLGTQENQGHIYMDDGYNIFRSTIPIDKHL